MNEASSNALPGVKAFLSHGYKSTDINLYFYDLLAETADIHFSVDEGIASTSVTRLERMARDVNMFMGIFSFNDQTALTKKALLEESKYFRLEVDIALRARKPALIFYDKRFGNVLDFPHSVYARPFDAHEIHSPSGKPSRDAQRQLIERFFDEAHAFGRFQSIQQMAPVAHKKVGVVTPAGGTGYGENVVTAIANTLEDHHCDPVVLRSSNAFDSQMYKALQNLDLIVLDIAETPTQVALASFLHGRFIPTIRMVREPDPGCPALEAALLAAFTAGYPKDIMRWRDITELQAELSRRLELLDFQARYIGTRADAETYFKKAALRKDAVFLSYADEDKGVASRISAALGKRFQTVFDYRKPDAILAGSGWMEQLYDCLARSAIGIPLLSNAYLKSGNCKHESEQMVANKDDHKMKVIGVKLQQEDVGIPSWLENLQYARLWEFQNEDALVESIIRSCDSEIQPRKVS